MSPAPTLFRTLLIAALVGVSGSAVADRVKDLASVGGVRSNQLIGYGLVVGLAGTGDQTSQTPFTVQSLRNMLTGLGVVLPANISLQLKNVAAVSVHAELPPFAKAGQTVDVTVSSLGNAKSLRGGSLLLSPLRGTDGEVYAIAQGNVVVGGLGVEGAGSSITVNVPSSGRIANGATVERPVPDGMTHAEGPLMLNLRQSDFTTAQRVADAINRKLHSQVAAPMDATTITVDAPADPRYRVAFLASIENIEVEPAETAAKVIVNSRTGTVVVGSNVRVFPAAITHGSLTVTITDDTTVSQPSPLSGGSTVVVPRQNIDVREEKRPMFLFKPGVKLEDIVKAVNQIGASPSDLVAILEALKAAGALRAELLVI
ncbi:MAG TPA: flagellar basal body P-ring protein FlgI [Plasticicumulans sp.]|nr:flagellar basal body P-ring protein FlgI [Plasticicumulans sp.]